MPPRVVMKQSSGDCLDAGVLLPYVPEDVNMLDGFWEGHGLLAALPEKNDVF